jgi:phosphatidate cytidylyltransferase
VIIKFYKKLRSLLELKEFRLRLLSSFVIFIVFYISFIIGNPLFVILLSSICFWVLFELDKMDSTKINKVHFFKNLLLQFILFIFLISKLKQFNFGFFLDFDIFLSSSLLINFYFINTYNNHLSFIYSNFILISFFLLLEILFMSDGLNLFLYIVLLITAMDVFAYIGGKLLGKMKIVPKISNGKTVEGTFIGLIFTVSIASMIRDLVNLDIYFSMFVGFFVGVLSFLGDILESSVKRSVGVKDSGNLIPGHGGLMDRLDGYILVLPVFYTFLILPY